MGLLEPIHLVVIAVLVMLLFGPKKIPELMRGLGKGMGELQKGINDGKAALHSAMHEIQPEPEPDPVHEMVVPEKIATTPQTEPVMAARPEPDVAAEPKAAVKKRKPAKSA